MNYFFDEVSKLLLSFGISTEELADYQARMQTYMNGAQYTQLHHILKEIDEKFPANEDKQARKLLAGKLTDFLKVMENSHMQHSVAQEKDEFEEQVVNALEKMVKASNDSQIISIPLPVPFEQIKQITRKINMEYCDVRERLIFVVSSDFNSSGSVTSSIYSTPRTITLVESHDKGDVCGISFPFVEKYDKRKYVSHMSLPVNFYFYRFTTDMDNDGKSQEYILLSQAPIKLQHCKIIGMEIGMRDTVKVGEFTKIPSSLPLIIVANQVPDVAAINEGGFRKWVFREPKTHDYLAQQVFSIYRHPVWFEKLILAWLLSGKVSSFPLHLGWLAGAGTGKSYFLMTLNAQFKESDIASGGTIKGLIPAFGDAIPSEGYLCRCRRVAMIDEFFSMLRRSQRMGVEVDSGTDMLTDILEHWSKVAHSGRGASSSIKPNPTMKLILATNTKTYIKMENIVEMAQVLKAPFLSRLLWYVQTEQHTKFIDDAKPNILKLEGEHGGGRVLPAYNREFIELYDYLNSFVLEMDYDKIRTLVAKFQNQIPVDLEEVYRSRYDHHLACLVDGIAKYRYIIQQRDKLEVRPEDYDEAEYLFGNIILSWNKDSDVMKMPMLNRIDFMPYTERRIYDIINKHPGVSSADVGGYEGSRYILQRLENIGVVKVAKGGDTMANKYYPYWFTLGD